MTRHDIPFSCDSIYKQLESSVSTLLQVVLDDGMQYDSHGKDMTEECGTEEGTDLFPWAAMVAQVKMQDIDNAVDHRKRGQSHRTRRC